MIRNDHVDSIPARSVPAIGGVALLLLASLSQFRYITTITGGETRLYTVIGIAIIVGLILGYRLAIRQAIYLSVVLFALSNILYFWFVPAGVQLIFSPGLLVQDTIKFLTGMSVLQLTEASMWAALIAPIPTFLVTYFTVRRRYIGASIVGGTSLGFFILTGDAGTWTTLIGITGLLSAVAFSRQFGGPIAYEWDTVLLIIAVIVIASLIAGPGGAAQPLFVEDDPASIEQTLFSGGDELTVVGSVSLDPTIRFTVESEVEANWRTDSFDRYTGNGWVRTGQNDPYTGPRSGPDANSTPVDQQITPFAAMGALPAAWQPVSVDEDLEASIEVTSQGDFAPTAPLQPEHTYTVTSEIPDVRADTLRDASTEDPPDIQEGYTQLPSTTPNRVGEFTGELLESADVDNRYDTAAFIEQYLQSTKDYSHDVERPEGDIADAFLFEMEKGYCTYYATTMVVMLRTQGIPARFVTGYSSGEYVGDDEYVVRGMNSHAWVEVYFPEHGWVEFDPTPAAAWGELRQDRLLEAREDDEVGQVDTTRTDHNPFVTEDDFEEPVEDNESNDVQTNNITGQPVDPDEQAPIDPVEEEEWRVLLEQEGAVPDPGLFLEEFDEEGEDSVAYLPPLEILGIIGGILVGILATINHLGIHHWIYRQIWLRIPQRTGEPTDDALHAYNRLEYWLGHTYRPRHPAESPRAYIQSLPDDGYSEQLQVVREIIEQAKYRSEGVSSHEAERVVEIVNNLIFSHTPIIRRFRS